MQQLSNLDFNNVAKAVNLPDPTGPGDAATKAYVDSAIEGLNFKDSVRVSTQSNINLAAPGASVDGIAMAANDRVLVRAQTTAAENGIYIWNGAAAAMTRAQDANTAAELEQAIVTVEEGTSANASFRQTSVNFTLGSGAVAFTTFGTSAGAASEATAGIAEIATQAEVDAGADTARFVTPATLAAYVGRLRRFAQTFGDGSATQFVITHNLNTDDALVQVNRTTGNKDTVLCDIERTSVNAVRLTFAAAPASNAFRAVILG